MYTLKIGGKTITLREGETVRVEGDFHDPEVTLTADPYSVFSCEGIRFHYPREFIFEADLESAHLKTWTLSGNDFKIMYFVFSAPIRIEDFLERMVERYGRHNCRVTGAAPLTFGPAVLTGTTIYTTLAGISVWVDVYQIPSGEAPLKLLLLQDCPGSAGSRLTEGLYAIQLLEQSSALEP